MAESSDPQSKKHDVPVDGSRLGPLRCGVVPATEGEWYPGRPLLVTENDYGVRLSTATPASWLPAPTAALPPPSSAATNSRDPPSRLSALDTVYAMTIHTAAQVVDTVYTMAIHKSQGFQFDTATVLLPAPNSGILTRELLYTAVMRARER